MRFSLLSPRSHRRNLGRLAFVPIFILFAVPLRAQEQVDFATQIRPILSATCFQCHGPDAATREADLRLDIADSAASVVHGSAPEILSRISTDDDDLRMPPADSLKQLSDEQKRLLTLWVQQGAPFDEHWSFSPPKRPNVQVDLAPKDLAWCKNPIDIFVLRKMRNRGFKPSFAASPETLLRRISLDLRGLPPSIEELDEYLLRWKQNGAEATIAEFTEQLIFSRDYGEHMALPWLEAARYADTDGYQNDRYRYQHAWRDWVIRAFNEKMPYDQFVIEQLAGDLLDEATLWQQVATGFGRNHRINSEDGSIPDEWLVENVVDRVDTLGTVFLGLTVGCARCHDHKYDPISQKEYYQLFAYFNSIAEHGVGPNNGNSPPFIELPKSWPLLDANENKRILPEPVKLKAARENAAGNGLKRPQPGSPKTVMVMHELETPRETYVLRRGRYNMPDRSEPLQPKVPDVLNRSYEANTQPANRLELAHWLVDPNNPLLARVTVNRLWQQFFGTGLVESSDDFGSQGAQPSHPELLDWLAVELMENGWSLQHIQQLIIQSSTYQQSSKMDADRLERDPKNKWLARGPRVRLPAFTLRDQALALSGLLIDRTGGPSAKPYMPEKIWSAISNNKYKQDSGANLFRRSLYTYWRRTIPPPTMMNFNASAREVCSVRSERTNTPLQALTLLNNKTFVEAARGLAAQSIQQNVESLDAQLRHIFRAATSRFPTEKELSTLQYAFDDFRRQIAANPASAKQLLNIGASKRDPTLNINRHASLTLVASMVLNLDEVITKE